MSEKNNNTMMIWGGTFVVAMIIIGVCVYIAVQRTRPPEILVEPPAIEISQPEQEWSKPAPITPEPEPEPTPEPIEITEPPVLESSIVNKEPEQPVAKDGPPQLLLDNLAGTLQLEIPFKSLREKIPRLHTCFNKNISPDILWSDAPPETQSYVIFLERLNGADEERFLNWAQYDIPAQSTRLDAGQGKDAIGASGGKHATSDHDNVGYIGPCESKGKFDYAFRLFALDTVLDVQSGVHKYDLIRAMNGHIIDMAEEKFIHYHRL